MDTRQIGKLNVSVVGLGCNNFGDKMDEQATTDVVNAALDAGINYFDTADGYSAGESEALLGRALGARRDQAVIATKFGSGSAVPEGEVAGSASWVAKAAERSMRQLGVDVIDHYLCAFLLILVGILQCAGVGWAFDDERTRALSEQHRKSMDFLAGAYWVVLFICGLVFVPLGMNLVGLLVWLFLILIIAVISKQISGIPFSLWYN